MAYLKHLIWLDYQKKKIEAAENMVLTGIQTHILSKNG